MFASIWKIFRGRKGTPPVSKRGAEGESLAARFLESKGLKIVERNWRCSIGELDIVAGERDILIFLEVKSAGKESDFRPEFRVNKDKQRRIRRLAHAYLKSRRLDVPVRFDIITVVWKSGEPAIEHIENAFS